MLATEGAVEHTTHFPQKMGTGVDGTYLGNFSISVDGWGGEIAFLKVTDLSDVLNVHRTQLPRWGNYEV